MRNTNYGSIQITDEDHRYAGSRYSEVRQALFANPYQKLWGAEDAPPLPRYEVTVGSVLSGILPFGKPWRFLQAIERTVDSDADLRWGGDKKGFRRLLHPNGIGLTGIWEILEETDYSGYFKKGSKALIVGRYSTCCTETRRGHVRSLAMAGKLYPTTDVNHADPLRTASFFTQQDLGGDFSDFINDAELRNTPDTRSWRRGAGLPVLLLEGAAFLHADKEPSQRQLYEIAELGKALEEATRTPEFMRLTVVSRQPRIEGDGLDFRDEIMTQMYDKGDQTPKRSLSFNIDVSDTGETKGTPVFQRRIISDWRTIGKITFTEAVVSYNGDFVLHFNHPTWRDDRNDPATATRIGGRKVR
ncbi:MAG: hypothetical protein PHY16_10995 [Methylobacter sp.]|nr:hypothetical protein [Methylobacter sp.]